MSASGAVVAKRKPGRPAKVASVVAPKVQKARKRRKMSAEARERIRQAQIKRWAALNAIQGEHERYGCATAQGEEEGRKGCLIGLGTFSDVDEIWAFDRALCLGIISATYQVATYQVQSLRFTR